MTPPRIEKITEIIVDAFSLDEDVEGKEIALTGVLKFTFDNDFQSNMIFVDVGTKQIGFITRAELVEFAQAVLQEWTSIGDKRKETESKPE